MIVIRRTINVSLRSCLKVFLKSLLAKQLNVVFCAIVMSRILFACLGRGGFLRNGLVAKFDAFFKKLLLFSKSCSLGLQQ